jgi:hypothetical protein
MEVRLFLRVVGPVEAALEKLWERRRNLDFPGSVGPAGLEQEHGSRRVFREAAGSTQPADPAPTITKS